MNTMLLEPWPGYTAEMKKSQGEFHRVDCPIARNIYSRVAGNMDIEVAKFFTTLWRVWRMIRVLPFPVNN